GFTVNLERPSLPLPQVVIDPEAIAQAFINLLDNAVKYSGDSKEIKVRLAEQDDFVIISVIDHGIGIACEEREKVFEKFYRVGNCLVHDVKGSGLGMSIVKHIVEVHHCKVNVEIELGRDSTFIIHLPVDESARVRNDENPCELSNGTYGSHETYESQLIARRDFPQENSG